MGFVIALLIVAVLSFFGLILIVIKTTKKEVERAIYKEVK